MAVNTAIRELVDLTIETDSVLDEPDSSSDEADSGSDEAESGSEWEEYCLGSDEEEKEESEAEEDGTNDHKYI